jgi:hypothetical protein
MEHVQAYFRNENEAEDVKVRLESVQAADVKVDKVPDNDKNLWDWLRDLFSSSGSYGEDDHNPHVVEFKVDEARYSQAKKIVKEYNGHFQ